MKQASLRKTVVLIVFVLAMAWGGVVSAFQVTVVAEDGVPSDAIRDAQIAAEKTRQFFADELRLKLDHDVKILLVPDRESYIQAQIRENEVSPDEAERRASTTRAWSQWNMIIQNSGAESLDTQDARIFNMSHELVHQYQRQVSDGKHTQLEWLAEGTADVIAARVLERDGRQTMEQFRYKRLEVIRDAESYPSLTSLRLPEEWYSSLDTHGGKVTYRVADIAVLYLLKATTYNDLFACFALLKSQDSLTAFERILGMKLEAFEEKIDLALAEELK